MVQRLYDRTQQDRWNIGIPGLAWNPTLAGLAGDAPHHVCGSGLTIYGRAQDMIDRNYFSHQIPPCGSQIFPAVAAAGVSFSAAAENMGWTSGSGASSPEVVNQNFINSPVHRANVFGDFNSVGVGAAVSPGAWSGGGASYNNVVMLVVIFARVPGVQGPWPPRPPAPPPPPPLVADPPPPAAAPAPPPPPVAEVQASGTESFLPRRKAQRFGARATTFIGPRGRSLPGSAGLAVLLLYLPISFALRAIRASRSAHLDSSRGPGPGPSE